MQQTTTKETKMLGSKRGTLTRKQALCADYVCWVDYLRPRAYTLYCKIPGAYRLYRLAERHQH